MIIDKNILITGGNSGIGFFGIINLLKTKNNLYIVIKSELRKKEFLRKISYFIPEKIMYQKLSTKEIISFFTCR